MKNEGFECLVNYVNKLIKLPVFDSLLSSNYERIRHFLSNIVNLFLVPIKILFFNLRLDREEKGSPSFIPPITTYARYLVCSLATRCPGISKNWNLSALQVVYLYRPFELGVDSSGFVKYKNKN